MTTLKSSVTAPSVTSTAVTPVNGLNVESMRIDLSFAPEITGPSVSTYSTTSKLSKNMVALILCPFTPPNPKMIPPLGLSCVMVNVNVYLSIVVVIVRNTKRSAGANVEGKKSVYHGAPESSSPTWIAISLFTDDLASNEISYVLPFSKGIFICPNLPIYDSAPATTTTFNSPASCVTAIEPSPANITDASFQFVASTETSGFLTKFVDAVISATTETVIVIVAVFCSVSVTVYVTLYTPAVAVFIDETTASKLSLMTTVIADVTSPSTLSSAVTPVNGLYVELIRIEASLAPEITGAVASTAGSSSATFNNATLSSVTLPTAPPNKNSTLVSKVSPV